MIKMNPCRFCGETKHLRIDTKVEEDWTFNADGSVKRTASGAFVVAELDYAVCSICNAQAPVEIWNRADGQWETLRASVLAGWEEHETAEKVVLGAIKAATGKTVHCTLDYWEKVSPRVPAAEFVAVLEQQLGLPQAPLEYGGCVHGIVSHFAGRVTA